MTEDDFDDRPGDRDRALWRRTERGSPVSQPADPGLIAAWLDLRLQGVERDRVEDLISRLPDWRDAMLGAAQSRDVPLPASVLARARKIGAKTTGTPVSGHGARHGLAGIFGWRQLASAGALASLVVVVLAGGFAMGQRAYLDLERIGGRSPEARLLLNDPLLDDGPDIFSWEG